MKIKAVFKIREVAIPKGYRRLCNRETIKAGDFVFFRLGTEECYDPIWNQLTDEEIIGDKLQGGQSKADQSSWIIRKIE